MTFNEAFDNVKNKLGQNPNENLKNIVNLWLEEIDLKKIGCEKSSIYSYYQEWLSDNYVDVGKNKNKVKEIALKIYKKLLIITDKEINLLQGINPLQGITEQLLFKKIEQNTFKKVMNNLVTDLMKNLKDEDIKNSVVLIGFVVTAIAISLYLESTKSSRSASPPKKLNPKREAKLLLLVINADKFESIISKLENTKKINENDGKTLYQATKYLWMGNENDFIKLNFQQSFEESEVTEKWEYDVKLVQIKLKNFDSGFELNSTNRLPAFLKLHEIAEEVKISKRLSSKAYDNPNLYR